MVARYGGKYGSRELTNYLNDIGERLATAANDSRWDFHFTILDEPNAIAFAVAGGYIYLSRTMLGLANSEAEIAAVLAHEMAHVIKRHGARRAEMENAQREKDAFCRPLMNFPKCQTSLGCSSGGQEARKRTRQFPFVLRRPAKPRRKQKSRFSLGGQRLKIWAMT
jgi:hypothetical protein